MKIAGLSSLITIAMIGGILFTVSLGCGGSSDAACTATVTYQGKTFEGKAANADEAKRNACNIYCREADPEYEARYAVWLDSAKGKAAGSPSKKEAIFKEADLMKFVTETCSKKCADSMNPTSTCK